MGQFSWYTNDGVRLLDDRRLQKPVYMVGEMPNGTIVTYKESRCYDGYGTFGGKDYYEFMAEINGHTLEEFNGDHNKLRMKGIDLAFDGDSHGENAPHKYPSLSLDGRWYGGVSPKSDPEQGWFVLPQDVESGLYDLTMQDVTKY